MRVMGTWNTDDDNEHTKINNNVLPDLCMIVFVTGNPQIRPNTYEVPLLIPCTYLWSGCNSRLIQRVLCAL